jgi:hypothetical protein
MSIPVLMPALTQTLNLPKESLQEPVLQYEPESESFLFDDGSTIYGYSSRCRLLFRIAARAKLCGWANNGANLYVQDGPVLCQYDLGALDAGAESFPVRAIHLENHQTWSSPKPAAAFKALFEATATASYSAPAIWNRDATGVFVHVLVSGDSAKVMRLGGNLERRPFETYTTEKPPDPPLALFAIATVDGPALQYLSGGQMVTLHMHPLDLMSRQPLRAPADHWLRVSRAAAAGAAQSQQSMAVDDTLLCFSPVENRQIYVAGRRGARPRIAVTSAAGEILGGDLGDESTVRTLLSAPVLVQTHGASFLFAVTTSDGSSALFEKYHIKEHLPGPPRHAWTVTDSHFRGIAPWLEAGAKGTSGWNAVPFVSATAPVFAAAIREAASLPDPWTSEQRAAAGSAAAAPAMSVAAASNTALPVAGVLHQMFGTPLAALLAGLSFSQNQIAAGLRSVDYTVAAAVAAIQPLSTESGWWRLPYTVGVGPPDTWGPDGPPSVPQPVSPAASILAAAIASAGYSSQEVAAACVVPPGGPDQVLRPVALLKAGYGMGAESVEPLIKGAGAANAVPAGDLARNLSDALCHFFAYRCLPNWARGWRPPGA